MRVRFASHCRTGPFQGWNMDPKRLSDFLAISGPKSNLEPVRILSSNLLPGDSTKNTSAATPIFVAF